MVSELEHIQKVRVQEYIEVHGNQRFKVSGTSKIAREVICHVCHERYWDYSSLTVRLHQCPNRLAGASVINKFG